MTQAKLVENAKQHVDLHLTPLKGGEAVTEDSIARLISNSPYINHHVNNTNIKNAIAELNDILKPLQDSQTGKELTYQILEKYDASVLISIDSDEMGASAEITTAQGGQHISAKAIVLAAQESGVKKGFCKEDLIKLSSLAADAAPNTKVTLQIASGEIAVNGKDASILPLVESAQSRVLRPKKQEDGSVDMRDLGDIICVKIGDPLVKKVPLTSGKEGFTVTANPLAPEPGNDVKLISGEGTAISPNNQNILISKRIGVPKLIDNGMEVDEVYKIKNVDVASGNITFTGSVIIEGDVTEGMTVIASGDVTVGGFVESATIEAGGDLTISGGIIGRKYDTENTSCNDIAMSVKINAKGKIYAKYCQYGQITSMTDIFIENQLMHSIIDVQGKLVVGTEEHPNGTLLGGYIKVGSYISAGIVGATAGSNTVINFETKLRAFKDRLHLIDQKIKTENDQSDIVKLAMNKMKKRPKEEQEPETLAKLVSTFQKYNDTLGKLLAGKEKAELAMQEYMSSVYIEATEKLFQGVELIIGDFNDKTRREYGPSKMFYKERKIHIDALIK